MADEKNILQLWRNPLFSGAYSGLDNFRTCLKHEKNIDISRNNLLKILMKDRNYVLEMRKVPKKIKRRSMNLHGYGCLWQADVAQMFEHNHYTGFLLCIDVYSRRLFCHKLKSKSKKDIQNAFKDIFFLAQVRPEKLETDQGSEFVSNKPFFKEEKIFLK